jgi:hypothetical protein
MKKAAPLAAALLLAAAAAGAASPFESNAALTGENPIDKLVLARLGQLGIEPAHLCSDAAFLRRAYLDVIGTLPTEQEARQFLAGKDPNRREALIDRLLDRDEFADYWAMKWSDLLRVKAEFPIDLWPNAAQAYHRWIRTSIQSNKPYDRFARELLTSSGSNFRSPPVNFYRAIQGREPKAIAQAVALTFMGERAEKWPKDRLDGMAAFFTKVGFKDTGEWKEEIVFFDPQKGPAEANAVTKARGAGPAIQPAPVFPDGTPAKFAADRDGREVFADWLTDPKNPYFARAYANRAWSWLMGRGIIHEPDDIRSDNPPSNPELLALLEKELVASHYDTKRLFRLILTSKTYQLSCIPASKRPEAAANFAQYPLRRLEAEVLIDALCQITGTTEVYTSAIPEPFTFVPQKERSIALPDGSISSSFLETFGRAQRDTGLESERNNRPTADQWLHMLNSSHIQNKIQQGPKLQALVLSRGSAAEIVTRMYLTILSRYPTEEELKVAEAYSSTAGGARWRDAAMDLVWAMFNSDEFLFRH